MLFRSLAPLAAVVLVAGNKLGFNPRYVLASSPAVLLLAAVAIAWLGRRWWPAYLKAIAGALRPGGIAALQYISIRPELFDAYARSGDNARIKQFAAEMLPTLKQHLQHVTSMQ